MHRLVLLVADEAPEQLLLEDNFPEQTGFLNLLTLVDLSGNIDEERIERPSLQSGAPHLYAKEGVVIPMHAAQYVLLQTVHYPCEVGLDPKEVESSGRAAECLVEEPFLLEGLECFLLEHVCAMLYGYVADFSFIYSLLAVPQKRLYCFLG